MNSDSTHSKDLDPAQDRLADALIAEHARLGTGSDEDLVANILLNTVNAPVEIGQFAKPAKPSISLGDWAKVAAVVIGIVSVGALALNQLGSTQNLVKTESRQEQTFHVIVESNEATGNGNSQSRINRKVLVSTVRGTNKLTPVPVGTPPNLAPIEIAEVDFSAPANHFGQSLDTLPAATGVKSTFRLASNNTTTTTDKTIYSGDVVLSHADFILKADSLVMDSSDKSIEMPVLKALNAVLTHRDGKYKAEASTISFDPSSGELVAQGINRLLNDGAVQTIDDLPGQIIFEGDQYFMKAGMGKARSN